MVSVHPDDKMFPREITTSEDIKLIENCLETHLKILQNAKEEQSVVTLLNEGTLKLILADTFKVIQASNWQNWLEGIVIKISDILFRSNEAGKEAKQSIITNLTENCIDLILCPSFIHIHKIELLKSFNTALEHCPLDTRQHVLTSKHVTDKLKTICKSLATFGDFELQVCIIEYLFRLIPKSVRTHFIREWIEGDVLASEFLNIRDSCFETDCRVFLNKLNLQNPNDCGRVYSVPAQFVKIDGEKIFKPSDNGYDNFWIDFNMGSKRIGIFCEPNFLSSQQSQEEMLWEIISIWSQDVKKYAVTVKNKISQITVELLPGAQMLVNRKELQSHLIVILLSGECDIKKILDATLKSQVKVSSVDPLCIITKREGDQQTYQESKNVSNNQHNSSQSKSNSASTKSKISVPSEPMRTPASSIVTNEFEEVLTWNTVQKRLKNGKEIDRAIELSNAIEVPRQEKNSFANATTDSPQHLSMECIANKDEPIQNGKSEVSVDINDKANQAVKSQKESSRVEDSLDSSLTNRKTQAKVRSSKKCTDMREHNLDARASDACVDVAKISPSITEGGDNNFPVRRSQRDLANSSKSCCKTSTVENLSRKGIKNSPSKEGNSKVKKANIKEKRKTSHSTSLDKQEKFLCKKRGKQDPSMTPIKTLRSGKKVKTPIQFVQDILKKTEGINSAKPDGASDFSADGYPNKKTAQSAIKDLRKRENFKKIPIYEKVHKPKISEIPTQNQKMKIKKDNGILSSKVADISTFTLAERNLRMKNISPGNISLDDFKPSKNFITVGKSLVKDKNKFETIDKSESATVICNSNGVGKEKKEAMLKDVIPSFQTHSASTSMTTVQSKKRSSKKAKKSESFMTSGSDRSSFLPELVVETSRQNEKDCEVIAETQIEQPSATLEGETIAYRSLNKQNQEKNKQVTLSKRDTVTQMKNAKNNTNISNLHHLPLNGSGDFHLTLYDGHTSSNMESSYVFNTKNAREKMCEASCKIVKSQGQYSPKKLTPKSSKISKRSKKINSCLEETNSLDRNDKMIPKSKNNGNGVDLSNYEMPPRVELSTNELRGKKEKNIVVSPALINAGSTQPTRNLRTRNKVVSYKESESPDVSLISKEKRATLSKTQKCAAESNEDLYKWNNVKATPDEKLRKSQVDDLIKRNGSLAPKKNVKNKTSLQGTWTRHEIKETFTMAYEHNSYSSDPYDFDAECELEMKQKLPLKPRQANSLNIKNWSTPSVFRSQHSNNQKTKSLEIDIYAIGRQPDKVTSGQNNDKYLHEKRQVKKMNWGDNGTEQAISNTEISENMISEKDASSKFSFEDNDSENSSCRGSSKFALYASQKAAVGSSSGLVFPHLEDSIPGTPDNEDDDCPRQTGIDENEKSLISEVSWLEKAKKQVSPKLTQSWKTYEKKSQAPNTTCEAFCGFNGTRKQANRKSGTEKSFDVINLKQGITTLYQTHKCTDVNKNKKGEKNKSKTNQKPLFELPQKSHAEYLTNEFAEEEIAENEFAEEEIAEMSHITSNCPGKRDLYGESWSTLSSKIDHQLQGVIDRMAGNIYHEISDVDLAKSYVSGPSSIKRPTKSELKRKYSSISSHSNDDYIETDEESSYDDGSANSKFVPKRLFETGVTPKRKNSTPDKIKLFEKLQGENKSSKDSKETTKESIKLYNTFDHSKNSNSKEKCKEIKTKEKKRCRDDYNMTPIVNNKKKKLSSESPSAIKESKLSSLFSKSQKSWDFTSLEGSPEKGRAVSFSKLSSNNFNLSPVLLATSSSSSPIPSINNSDSLLKLDRKELELPDPVNLFDSFRKDILKSAVPLASEHSSELSAQTTDDDAEVHNAGSGSLREFIASKQKKKIPPPTDVELRDIMKSTSKVLQSTYESEQSRILEVKKFKDIFENVVGRMNKSLKQINQSEVTLATLWTQHMEKLKNNRLTQEKELKQLRSAHEALKKNLGEAFSNGQNVKKSFKAALKQDIDALQRKHLAKVNAHSLDAMRRCFYANSLMFT